MLFELTKGTKRCEQSVVPLFVNFEPHSVQHLSCESSVFICNFEHVYIS